MDSHGDPLHPTFSHRHIFWDPIFSVFSWVCHPVPGRRCADWQHEMCKSIDLITPFLLTRQLLFWFVNWFGLWQTWYDNISKFAIRKIMLQTMFLREALKNNFIMSGACFVNKNQLEKLEAAKAAWLVGLSFLSLTGPYWALLGYTGLYWAVLGCTGLYWAVLGCTGPYLATLGLTRPYSALLGLTGP